LDKESAKELLKEFGNEKETQQVLWIAWNLNQTNGGRRGQKFIDDDNIQGGDIVDLSKVKITEDIAFAQELLKTSGLDYYQATNNRLKDVPNNLIQSVISTVTDNSIYDFVKFASAALGFSNTDEQEKAKSRGLQLASIQAAGGKITYNADGSATVRINPKDGLKAKSDNTKLPTKVTTKLLKDVEKEKKEVKQSYEKLTGWNAYNMNVNSPEYKQFQKNQAAAGAMQIGTGIPSVLGNAATQRGAANSSTIRQLFNKN